MAERIPLKDQLFNRRKVEQIAGEIARAHPSFEVSGFVRATMDRLPELELKARISWIAECLKRHLPRDYRRAVGILLKALPAPNNPHLTDDDFGDFIYAPYADYVAKNGCTEEYFKFSLNALHAITQRFSAEDAIRSFINVFPRNTLKELMGWATDSHYHVRRLCSEGTRPKLPWSHKLTIPITAPMPILDKLFADSTRFVTRSVANHINDISKSDPDLAVATLSRWRSSGMQSPAETDYIIRHALRSLVRSGHPKAMKLLGASPKPNVRVVRFDVPSKVTMNAALPLSLTIRAREDARIIADYLLHFQNKTGRMTRKKVFKLTALSLKKGASVVISKRHILRRNMTTRTLYSGRHAVELHINGSVFARREFDVV
jgi:3-methyladenine DNA glycosylase AlkC